MSLPIKRTLTLSISILLNLTSPALALTDWVQPKNLLNSKGTKLISSNVQIQSTYDNIYRSKNLEMIHYNHRTSATVNPLRGVNVGAGVEIDRMTFKYNQLANIRLINDHRIYSGTLIWQNRFFKIDTALKDGTNASGHNLPIHLDYRFHILQNHKISGGLYQNESAKNIELGQILGPMTLNFDVKFKQYDRGWFVNASPTDRFEVYVQTGRSGLRSLTTQNLFRADLNFKGRTTYAHIKRQFGPTMKATAFFSTTNQNGTAILFEPGNITAASLSGKYKEKTYGLQVETHVQKVPVTVRYQYQTAGLKNGQISLSNSSTSFVFLPAPIQVPYNSLETNAHTLSLSLKKWKSWTPSIAYGVVKTSDEIGAILTPFLFSPTASPVQIKQIHFLRLGLQKKFRLNNRTGLTVGISQLIPIYYQTSARPELSDGIKPTSGGTSVGARLNIKL